ncbi:DUF2637 domain-containing protein [Streptomyces antarcticus]|uniref:DUF2637 domain-containing protein n=1 Tax=Streptomyces antarcticus TaxID=2996458 RepID=UPI002271F999|nr:MULTISPECIES: DUF2637 domain-containing protein [unclassified Streptomyces]MCY0945895.1 DUF2637 domain-containing protein [Streptomyces sp. H34-AA3]MCZ4083315.1 DUF2637 domain-containing protein [Streptomyces sp. H34-S5]
MPSPTIASAPTPAPAQPTLAAAIRTGVALMALGAFALSYDALRQMAAASHIHPVLTYAFPLVVDGFIAIGIGALLVLRTAPLRARLYVAALVSLATGTSIWANVLHAIRLNQQSGRGSLALDDITVGTISAIAPLSLAGAVHLYLLVQRRPTHPAPSREPARAINRSLHPRSEHGSASAPEPQPITEVASSGPEQVAEPAASPVGHPDRQSSATLEQAIEIGRTAPLGRGGKVSRRHIEKAIRDKGLRVGRERLDQAKDFLQTEHDDAQANPTQQ